MLHDPAGGAGVVAGGDVDVDDAYLAGTDRSDGFSEGRHQTPRIVDWGGGAWKW